MNNPFAASVLILVILDPRDPRDVVNISKSGRVLEYASEGFY